MQITEKQELVRLLNLYQSELLEENQLNIKRKLGGTHTDYQNYRIGIKSQYEHARIISAKLAKELQEHIAVW